MLFGDAQRAGILAGTITMTVRRWSRPQARLGGRYRLDSDSVVVVDALDRLSSEMLSDVDAAQSGFSSREALLAFLEPSPDELLTRIAFHVEREADPRVALGRRELDEATRETLRARLARMDDRSAVPWTRASLVAIARRPATRAAELAKEAGKPTPTFKADIRKLKALGLTRSLDLGYELTPLGASYLVTVRPSS